MKPFRFALQIGGAELKQLVREAQAAERAGFDVVVVGDHVDQEWEPLTLLAALAAETERIRLGTLVLNNDLHNPVLLARQVSALDHLSGGRFELGLGAGHTWQEYDAVGLAFDPPAVRKARLAESVEIIRALLAGEEVTFAGTYHRVRGARIMPPAQSRVPVLVGGSGSRLLAHAAKHADIVGLTGLGRTLPDGQRHEPRWQPDVLDAQIAHIRHHARDRWPALELNVLVQVVEITDDRHSAAERLAERIDGLTADDALSAPFVALGTHDEIAAQYWAARERWGISYLAVRSLGDFAPVIERLKAA